MRSRTITAVLVGALVVSSGVMAVVEAPPAEAMPCLPYPPSSVCNPEGMAVMALLEGDAGATTAAAVGKVAVGVTSVALGTAVVVTATGYKSGTLVVDDGGVEGLEMPQVQAGWVGGRHQVQANLTFPRQTSWTVGYDPVAPVAGETIPVVVRLDVCRPSGTGTANVGVRAYYAGGGWSQNTSGLISYDNRNCGAPVEVTVNVAAVNNGKNLERVEAYDQGIVGCGYGDLYPCLTWYPQWSTLREDVAGQGTLTRWLRCVDADGNYTEVSDTWEGDISVGGTYELPELSCPPGSVVESFRVDWTSKAYGSGPQTVVPTTTTPGWVTGLPGLYPSCYVSGAQCRMDLWDVSGTTERWCGNLAVDCLYWYVSPNRAAHYECRFGPYRIDLSVCSALRDPGSIRPNSHKDVNGHSVFDGFVPLELGSNLVGVLVTRLYSRHATEQGACEALAESVRHARGSASVVVPDVVWDCTEYGVADALWFVAATGDSQIAVNALADAALFASQSVTTFPDCDQLAPNGTCADPAPRTVRDTRNRPWSSGPRPLTWTKPTPSQVDTVLDTCTGMAKAASPGLTTAQARDKCESTPIFVPGGAHGGGYEAAVHDRDVITAHPHLVQLQYATGSQKKEAGIGHQWYLQVEYRAVCEGKTGGDTLKECDEYPFYTSVEGGPSAHSAYGQKVLKPVSRADNRNEGSALWSMYRDSRCHMTSATLVKPGVVTSSGTMYLVVPMPEVDVDSFYLCPQI